ncbi:MAG: 5-(carboxyamino)imidazole ribonucleotide mutase [Bacillota bacterium]|nr:5-(carboxyamino)imidazole ribonucleotide mutase [Bacillota bacterium]
MTDRHRVGIVMGSDSDLPVMREAAKTLEQFGVGFEVAVLSAHRTPDDAVEYARTAAGRGIGVIIAGAGGAAHLPGVLAAYTTVPVIGVPLDAGKGLGGVDALYSIVQMPPGVPVAAVGINGARNAALLAVAILSLCDQHLREALRDFRHAQAASVRAKAERLTAEGLPAYVPGGGAGNAPGGNRRSR